MLVMPEYFCNSMAEKQRGMNIWLKLLIWLLVLLAIAAGICYWKYPCVFPKVYGFFACLIEKIRS